MGNQNSMKSKSYGISDALSELMEAAVMADTNASKKSYEMIKQYAYGFSTAEEEQSSGAAYTNIGGRSQLYKAIDSIGNNTAGMKGGSSTTTNIVGDYDEEEGERSLAMAKFTMRSPDGGTQEVSIPQITMIPLPLLHVTEATFDLALSVNLVEKSETLDPQVRRPRQDPAGGSGFPGNARAAENQPLLPETAPKGGTVIQILLAEPAAESFPVCHERDLHFRRGQHHFRGAFLYYGQG